MRETAAFPVQFALLPGRGTKMVLMLNISANRSKVRDGQRAH